MSEQGRSKDSVKTWKQRHGRSTNGVKSKDSKDKWESLHYLPTAFLLYSYCVHTTSITYPPRSFQISAKTKVRSTTLYKTTLSLFHICSVLNTSVVCLYEVLIASMVRPAIKYKYFTEFLKFICVSTFIMNTQNKNVLLQCALYQGNQSLLEALAAFVLLRRIRQRRNRILLAAPLAFGCLYHTDSTNINIRARLWSATHFLAFMSSLATFWKHSSLKKTWRTN